MVPGHALLQLPAGVVKSWQDWSSLLYAKSFLLSYVMAERYWLLSCNSLAVVKTKPACTTSHLRPSLRLQVAKLKLKLHAMAVAELS